MRFPIPKLSTRVLLLSVSVLLLAGCEGAGEIATAPEDGPLAFEEISVAEIAGSAFLDDLSEEDKAAVRAALQAAREEIRAIIARFRAGEISREEARAEIAGVHSRLIETLGQFLTDEQIDRLLQDRPGRPRPDLDLTEEQLAQIRELRAEFHAFVREIRAAVGAGELTAREGRRQIRAKAQETRQALCAILTPSQQAKVPFCRVPGGAGR
ncbi:MAG TPA: hypothetical protein VM737_10130 [Gemmatimonadota bacterium]|nr:hypothetical protein [Gemmatimonadota bacterium]